MILLKGKVLQVVVALIEFSKEKKYLMVIGGEIIINEEKFKPINVIIEKYLCNSNDYNYNLVRLNRIS